MKGPLNISALQFMLTFDATFFDFWQKESCNDTGAKKLLKLVSLENVIIGSVLVQDDGICRRFKRTIVHDSNLLTKRRKLNFGEVSQIGLKFSDLKSNTSEVTELNPLFISNPNFRNRQCSDKAESESECPSSLEVESGTQCNCVSSLDGEQCGKSKCKENVSDFQFDVSVSRLNVDSERLSSSDDSDLQGQRYVRQEPSNFTMPSRIHLESP